MKRFLDFAKPFRWLIAVVFTTILLWILLTWVSLLDESILWVLAIFLIVPIIQFLSTPLFTLLGLYTYYSPMVVRFGSSSQVIDLHNGSSFDYLLEMRGVSAGLEWKHKMLLHYLNALLRIIELIERGDISESVRVRGSSYFLSERSAKRFGFSVTKTSLLEKLNIGLNYIDLVWTYSLANGRLTFPNLNNISTVSITGKDLLEQKGRISDYVRRLKKVRGGE